MRFFYGVRNKLLNPKITQQPCSTLPSGTSVQLFIACAPKQEILFEILARALANIKTTTTPIECESAIGKEGAGGRGKGGRERGSGGDEEEVKRKMSLKRTPKQN